MCVDWIYAFIIVIIFLENGRKQLNEPEIDHNMFLRMLMQRAPSNAIDQTYNYSFVFYGVGNGVKRNRTTTKMATIRIAINNDLMNC